MHHVGSTTPQNGSCISGLVFTCGFSAVTDFFLLARTFFIAAERADWIDGDPSLLSSAITSSTGTARYFLLFSHSITSPAWLAQAASRATSSGRELITHSGLDITYTSLYLLLFYLFFRAVYTPLIFTKNLFNFLKIYTTHSHGEGYPSQPPFY